MNTNYKFTQPMVTEAYAEKLRAEKANVKTFDATPAEISAAVLQAMNKDFGKLFNASSEVRTATIEQEIVLLRGGMCA